MSGLKSLAKDTAIYGMSSIIGRFLNYLLVPLYTAKLSVASGGYGIVTNIYAMTALFLIILTYGMETGFFRFVNDQKEKAMTVYSTTLIAIGSTSLLFIILCLLYSHSIADHFGYNPGYIQMMAIVVAIDAFQCIPFAYLRYRKRPVKFAALKLLFIISNIILNLAFFVWFPAIYLKHSEWISWIYNPTYGVGYVFLANLICTLAITFCFIKELTGFPYVFDKTLLKRMIRYSFPILFLGIAGILNQSVDKIIYPLLFTDKIEANIQLGIYGAASKIAMIMALLTQAFRYAYEPFVFGKSKDTDNRQTYADVMKFFIIFTLLAFLGVMFYLDILRYIIASDYWAGLKVVPIVMAGSLCMGVYFNLSFWYKLIDKTIWGVYFSLVGCILVIGLNIAFVPVYGYIASAWSGLAGFAVIMVLSYIVGQKQYPIHYDLKSIGKYVLLALLIYIPGMYFPIESLPLRLLFRTLLLFIFIIYTLKKDFPLHQIPIINRYIKK